MGEGREHPTEDEEEEGQPDEETEGQEDEEDEAPPSGQDRRHAMVCRGCGRVVVCDCLTPDQAHSCYRCLARHTREGLAYARV
jgi:hypothetical protein